MSQPAARLHPQVQIVTVTSAMFDENAYLLYFDTPGDSDRRQAVVVDPGLEPEPLVEALQNRELTPEAIVCTHGHADHIAGNAFLKERYPQCPLIIGVGDEPKLSDPVANLSAGFGFQLTSPPADETVAEGDRRRLGGIAWRVVDTPGHSSGHVAFIADELSPPLVLGGDLLFAGSIGRSDFPDSDPEALVASIRDKLYTLPDETLVLTGHGPTTTIGEEKRTNPFVRG